MEIPGCYSYPPGVKGYKLYNLAFGKIMISRNVKFHEDILPFVLQQSYNSSITSQTQDPFHQVYIPQPVVDTSPIPELHDPSFNDTPAPSPGIINEYESTTTIQNFTQPSAPTRSSSRQSTLPCHLNDFHVTIPNLRSSNSINDFLSYD